MEQRETIEKENVWSVITIHQGETFYTKKGLPFVYTIRGGEMFTERRERSITRSTFEVALERIRREPERITGPKALNMYGAPYVWAVLKGIGAI